MVQRIFEDILQWMFLKLIEKESKKAVKLEESCQTIKEDLVWMLQKPVMEKSADIKIIWIK